MIDLELKSNPYKEKKKFLEEAIEKSTSLPKEIRIKLENFKKNGNKEGFLLIENLPTDIDLIPTPENHNEVIKTKKTFISESALAIIGSYLGSLYGYQQESEGSYFNNIRPTNKNKNIQSSESSSVFLELHTEIAFHNVIPDFILIYCLRDDRDKKAKTGVSCIRNAIKLLDNDCIEELMKKSFKIGVDYSFTGSIDNKKAYKEMSILSGPKNDPYIIYDADLIKAENKISENAIKQLDEALRKKMNLIPLKKGDLIIIDNKRSIHSRTEFKAYYDGKDRWLQRAFVKQCKYQAESLYKKELDIIDETFI